MIDDHIKVVPITDAEMLEAVFKAAELDNDGIFDPTHAVIRNGEIVGAVSIAVACGSWWMDSKKVKRRDSLMVFRILDALFADRRILRYLMPCKETSPFYKIMERVGFKKMEGNWGLFLKK